MTVKQLHIITGELIASNHGESDVAIDFATFQESENGTVLCVDSAEHKQVQGADDSGPVGPEFPFLVLKGAF